MQNEISKAIVDSVHDIFLAFLSLEVSPGPAIAKPEFEPYTPPESEATATVGFSGGLKGGIHLSCPMYVALALAASFSGEEYTEMDAEASDGFGELANMVAGGLQSRLSEKHGEINLTPPNVIRGSNFAMSYNRSLNSIKQYFRIEHGPFFVECFYMPVA
ncbi:chemotaxis protein CheX [Magnetofaba australis]|uniref:Putative chemotaxis protein CheX n=1 Tax=Magnetofaba australis IT-1 TaxID=1434232 RepID=A0A1Y2K6T1_9PROT|nr:chemotaxis protein CheX [Magnetofaba australis]OSM05017.1 putative chemotaxis protein CheX [Magnetofaba australis IT-1]